MPTTSTISLRPTMTIGRSTMVQVSMLVMTRTARVCPVTRWKAVVRPAQCLGPFQGYQPTLPAPPSRPLRVPAQPWTRALASDLRSSLAVHFLNHRRLFAADGPSTSPYAVNALLPMSVLVKLAALKVRLIGYWRHLPRGSSPPPSSPSRPARAAVPPEQPQPRRQPVTQHQPAGPAAAVQRPALTAQGWRGWGAPGGAGGCARGKVALYFLYSRLSTLIYSPVSR